MEIIKGQSITLALNSDTPLTGYTVDIFAFSYPSKAEFQPTSKNVGTNFVSCVWSPELSATIPAGKFTIVVKLTKDGKSYIGRSTLGSLISDKSVVDTQEYEPGAEMTINMSNGSANFDLTIGNILVDQTINENTNAVLFTIQNLTTQQKENARANIGAQAQIPPTVLDFAEHDHTDIFGAQGGQFVSMNESNSCFSYDFGSDQIAISGYHFSAMNGGNEWMKYHHGDITFVAENGIQMTAPELFNLDTPELHIGTTGRALAIDSGSTVLMYSISDRLSISSNGMGIKSKGSDILLADWDDGVVSVGGFTQTGQQPVIKLDNTAINLIPLQYGSVGIGNDYSSIYIGGWSGSIYMGIDGHQEISVGSGDSTINFNNSSFNSNSENLYIQNNMGDTAIRFNMFDDNILHIGEGIFTTIGTTTPYSDGFGIVVDSTGVYAAGGSNGYANPGLLALNDLGNVNLSAGGNGLLTINDYYGSVIYSFPGDNCIVLGRNEAELDIYGNLIMVSGNTVALNTRNADTLLQTNDSYNQHGYPYSVEIGKLNHTAIILNPDEHTSTTDVNFVYIADQYGILKKISKANFKTWLNN